MSVVTLVSGGLDSTVMAIFAHEVGLVQYPLFIDYGQLNLKKELNACLYNFQRYGLPAPEVMEIGGYGAMLSSGLTDSRKNIFEDAFLPCRNLLFLTAGAAHAYQHGANSVAIGLLDEKNSIFPDQTMGFISNAEKAITKGLGRNIIILTPLISFSKAEIVQIAKMKKIDKAYSCHAGTDTSCGVCVACREYININMEV